MDDKVAIPVKGQPLKASWAAAVANRVNGLGAMFPSGGLARDGVTGTGFAQLPQNIRERKAAPKDVCRYAIKSISETTPDSSSSTLTLTLKNLYYDVRCQTYVATDEDVVINKSGASFVALQILKSGGLPDATLVTYTSFVAMQNAQKDFSKAVIPLYKFTDGKLECDFRTGPSVQAWEFSE